MIQVQFPSVQSNQFIIPKPPNIANTHHKPQTFSSRILKHGGPARDTTIHAATKAAARQKTQFTKNFTQMDEIMAEFAAELDMIEKMKKEVIVTQQHMALSSLRWYSAVSIQQCYRGSRSRFALKKLRKARLIVDWVRFRVYYKHRCKVARYLSTWARSWWTRRKFLVVIKANAASRRIQRRFRNRRDYRILLHRIQLLLTVKRTVNHSLLFGTSRARRTINLIRNPISPEIQKLKPFRSFMMSCLRKRRLRL